MFNASLNALNYSTESFNIYNVLMLLKRVSIQPYSEYLLYAIQNDHRLLYAS